MRELPIEGASRTPLRPKYPWEAMLGTSPDSAMGQRTESADEGACIVSEGERVAPEEPLLRLSGGSLSGENERRTWKLTTAIDSSDVQIIESAFFRLSRPE